MPYVAREDREKLDEVIDEVVKDLVNKLKSASTPAELSTFYRQTFTGINKTIYKLLTKELVELKTSEEKLAGRIYELDRHYGYDAAFNGELNYSTTRIIQLTPKKMVEQGIWKEELRYWIYSQTVGALMRAQDDIKEIAASIDKKDNDWIFDGFVGVLEDVKDEYKRRVNTAYEAVQIKKSGDCYDTPYHTELVDVKDKDGNVVGWQEVMKDYRHK
ncbi:hypothetical protein IHE50_00680 [Candidatus Parvarchaeota archaeon]|uniref:Uncharacterized protein n=1 Tax=Candidatus Acidifodinimicrobium mancum TaxID=2898728 RepID=A0A8T3V0G7_9ARCH|nr:hypothetical protein [Candidatus Acidifodinimicrobium mancum]